MKDFCLNKNFAIKMSLYLYAIFHCNKNTNQILTVGHHVLPSPNTLALAAS